MVSFNALIVFITLKQKIKLKSHGKICKKYFSIIVMPSEKDNVSKFNHCMKSDEMICNIYADNQSLI